MVYQISEKNQILIALFGIVVLCAGKLFKDYLNRSGYIEGFTYTTETDPKRIIRGVAGDNKTAKIYLLITLGEELANAKTITVTWSGHAANDITLSNNVNQYKATVENTSTGSKDLFTTTSVTSSSVIFTSTAVIKAKSWIKIAINSVTITGKAANNGTTVTDNVDKTLRFTVTPDNGEPVLSRDVTVVKTGTASDSTGDFTSSTTMTVNEIDKAIDSIDARLLSPTVTDADRITYLQSRAALISMLASTYGTVKEAGQVFDSDALYKAQKTAIDFIEKEKDRSTKNANTLSQDNSNKRRMAQVNTYYTRHYEANTDVMKNIIYVSVSLIILAVLRNKELIPASISTLGIILILTFGGIVIGTQVFDIIRRNDHEFDKYDWNFNEDEMSRKELVQQNNDPANLSEMGMGGAACYGPGCCDTRTLWDNTLKRCVASRITGSATWSTTTPGSAAGNLTLSLKNSYMGSLPTSGTITVTIPSGMFTATAISVVSGGTISGNATTTSIIITPSAVAAAGGTITDIVISGLSMDATYTAPKTISVNTSVDPNPSTIPIS
jgi:nucleoid-associated protein YgaU